MERRNWSLEALSKIQYIDSLDDDLRAQQLEKWINLYLVKYSINDFDLSTDQFKTLQELFYKNNSFLKKYIVKFKTQVDDNQKIKEFLL